MNDYTTIKPRFKQRFHIRKLSTRLMLAIFLIAVVIVASTAFSLFIPNSALFQKQVKKELGWQTDIIALKLDEEIQSQFPKGNPEYDGSGYPIGQAAQSVSSATIGKTGYAVLVDSQGVIQSHPNPSLIGSKLADLKLPEVLAAYESVRKGNKDVSYNYTFNGVHKIGHSSATKNGYVIQMAVPKNELTEPLTDMMRTALIAAALVTLAAIGLTCVFAARWAKPTVYYRGGSAN